MTPEEQRNKLLNELQSLQNALNKTNAMSNEQEQEIPTLTQSYQPDVEADSIPTLEDSIPTLEDSIANSPLSPTDKSIDQNPYLPRDIIERLASQASALSEQIKQMESEDSTQENILNEPAVQKNISEERKQQLINELIEDMLPNLMRELRARLNNLI